MPLRLPAVLFAALLPLAVGFFSSTAPAHAADFTDAAGRRVQLPVRIDRVLPAERNAEVLVLVLAPDRLAGLERSRERGARLPHSRYVAALGWRARSNPAGMAATARRVRADLIIDAGPVTPERAAFADAVQLQSGIPYILVDDSFARMPAVLRSIGAILGASDRADDLGIFAEHAIAGLHGRLLIRPADTRPRVYYALGASGLWTPLPGSPLGASIEEAGAINVAGALGRGGVAAVGPAQLLGWNPEIVIAERASFYRALLHDPRWRRLKAVRDKHVYLEPNDPFGWIENPSGVNRLIGLHWLSALFYADATQEDLRTTTCDFYEKFYRIKLTNAHLDAMLRTAGIRPSELPHPVEPLVGLGAAPPSTLAPATPGRPSAVPPAAAPPLPGMPNTAPTAACTVPTGPTPQPLPGLGTAPAGATPSEPPASAPGVPPPGRRGRAPGAGLGEPGALPR